MMSRKTGTALIPSVLITFAIASLGPFPMRGNQNSLLPPEQEKSVVRELSGILAKEYVSEITRYDRTTTLGYQQAMHLIAAHLREMGIEDVRVENYTGVPEQIHFAPHRLPWWPPFSWRVRKAQLWLEPEKKLADYEEQPISLARYSRTAKLSAEAVFVEAGIHDGNYVTTDVKDKIVVATGDADVVYNQAVAKRGALGVVIVGLASYAPEVDKGQQYPDMIGWQVLNPVPEKSDRPSFAFSLSVNTGNELIELIRTGKKPRLLVDIDADVFRGTQEVLTAVLPGSEPRQEFLFVAHLDHPRPSANDNASGSGLLLELARCLSTLAREGKFKPRRSIRFLWVTEGAGTFGYIQDHPDIAQRVVGALNLDMVGEDQIVTHSVLRISRTPDSLPSFMNDVVLSMADRVDALDLRSPLGTRGFFNFRVMPPSVSSDHYVLNDGSVRVPTVMLSHNPDDFHHTNMDTTDKVDPTELKRLGFISATTAIFVSTAGAEESPALAATIFLNGHTRLAEIGRQAAALLLAADSRERGSVFRTCEMKLHSVVTRELATLDSARALGTNEASDRFRADLSKQLSASELASRSILAALFTSHEGQPPPTEAPTALEKQMKTIVPRTSVLFLRNQWEEAMEVSRLTAQEQQWLRDYKKRLDLSYMRIPEFLNFVDGKSNLWDIAERTGVEALDWDGSFRPIGAVDEFNTQYGPVDPEDVLKLFSIFRKAGLVEW